VELSAEDLGNTAVGGVCGRTESSGTKNLSCDGKMWAEIRLRGTLNSKKILRPIWPLISASGS
jgi:hypothetical protein